MEDKTSDFGSAVTEECYDLQFARAAFQKFRKARKHDGYTHKPDWRTAFYSGYLSALNDIDSGLFEAEGEDDGENTEL